MKVIDLLNKIANGEEPKKIKIGYWVYDEKYEDLEYEVIHRLADGDFTLCSNVEIIEEVEEPKKINELRFLDNSTDNEDILRMKINEIIDFLNQGDKE